jgi:putative transposase
VQNELYLLELYQKIELNPVRAGMVEEPSAYSWSSYSIDVNISKTQNWHEQ